MKKKTLYVVDNHPIIPVRKLWAFPLDGDGNIAGDGKELYDWGTGRGGDGLCIDQQGNVWKSLDQNQICKHLKFFAKFVNFNLYFTKIVKSYLCSNV